MKKPKKIVNFRVTEVLAADLKEVSERLDISQAEIARAALSEKVAELNEKSLKESEVALAR